MFEPKSLDTFLYSKSNDKSITKTSLFEDDRNNIFVSYDDLIINNDDNITDNNEIISDNILSYQTNIQTDNNTDTYKNINTYENDNNINYIYDIMKKIELQKKQENNVFKSFEKDVIIAKSNINELRKKLKVSKKSSKKLKVSKKKSKKKSNKIKI